MIWQKSVSKCFIRIECHKKVFIQIELLYGYVRQHVFFLTNMHNTTSVNIFLQLMVAIKRFNLMMARDLCLSTGFHFKYFVSCRMVVMSICILILLWFLAPSKWYSTRPISSFFDEGLMKFTSGSWVNRVPTLLTIVLKTKQDIFSCYIMKIIIL